MVSILMPVKNTGRYLAACLDSILAQTYQDWELIAINDHSTDNSLAILEDYAQQDKRIQVYTNVGKGIIAALRLAYSKSKGALISRMDSDDLMSVNKLEYLRKRLKDTGEGYVATGQVQYFAEGKLGQGYLNYANWLNALTQKGSNFKEIYKECVIPSPCWMVYRADLDRCGAFEPDRYPEDYDLCFRFYAQNLKVLPTTEVLHQWRDYNNRTSRTDAHYANNQFTAIKTHYFSQLDYDAQRPLVVWGVGRRGKAIAQALAARGITFHWLCNNPKKIGHIIYDTIIKSVDQLSTLVNPQVIVSVASPDEQPLICQQLTALGLVLAKDYFLFC